LLVSGPPSRRSAISRTVSHEQLPLAGAPGELHDNPRAVVPGFGVRGNTAREREVAVLAPPLVRDRPCERNPHRDVLISALELEFRAGIDVSHPGTSSLGGRFVGRRIVCLGILLPDATHLQDVQTEDL
jgi:hypothetical protein